MKNIFYLIAILIFYILYELKMVKEGEVSNLGFELYQLFYIIITFFEFDNIIFKSIIVIIFLVHIVRLILNKNKIILQHYKNFKISTICFTLLIYLLLNNYDTKYPYLHGIIYGILAINSFVQSKKSTKLYSDIPFTLCLLFLFINREKYVSNKILPVVIGDLIYHLYELILYFSKNFNSFTILKQIKIENIM
jgi:hypothetical protein